jgi:hypothetical protein
LALANLKTYLDLGGVLVATPDSDPKAFAESIRSAALRIYPAYAFERMTVDHPLMGLVYQVELPESDRPWVLSNGVRDLIVLAPMDWGMPLQAGRNVPDTGAEQIMSNLHALVTDRGSDDVRLEPSRVERIKRDATGTLRVIRLVEPGHEPLEPLAWRPLINRLYNRTGLELEIVNASIDQIERTDAPLVYLGGSDAQRLSPQSLRQLVGYIRRGGTVLIETIGGRGDYTFELLPQLEAVLGEPAVPVRSDHPVVTGQGIGNAAGQAGGEDLRRIAFRRYSNLTRGPVESQRLLTIKFGGRAAVIASHEDLSLGVMGSRRWGIDGYDTASARGLLTNILLYVAGDTIEGVSEPATDESPGKIHLLESP